MINKERIVDSFIKYVKMDSPTQKEGVFARKLVEELKNLDFEVYIDDAGKKVGSDTGNIIAKLKGTKECEPILFSSHMDTVSPSEGVKPIIKDGVIYSDGTTVLGGDDKAGIAAILEAVKVLKEKHLEHGPIEIVFSIYEEGGLFGAKNLDYSKIHSKRACVLDSGGDVGQIIIKGPAQDKINATIIGKPAHAGVCPEEGISAIQVAAKAICDMNLLRIDEETTANIGVIEGGKVTNIVCPKVYLKAEARSLNDEKLDRQTKHMVECLENAAKCFHTKVEVETKRMYTAFNVSKEDALVQLVKECCEKMGIKGFTKASGGGSDTNIFNSKGIRAVNLGIGQKKAHTLEEHISIEDLVKSSKLVLEIIQNACK